MSDLIKRLREDVIVEAFATERITDGQLADRLIRERHEAAYEIERLRSLATQHHQGGEVEAVEEQWRYRRVGSPWSAWQRYSPTLHSYADFEKEMRPLYALAQQPLSVQERWRPIETAPIDGTDILVCVTYNLSADEWETKIWVDWQVPTERWPCYWGRIDIPFSPTHWQPLPAAPTVGGTEE